MHKINRTQTLIFSIFLSLAIVFSFGIGAVSADQSQIYVNTAGNDSWDGQSATWNGTSGPKLTVKNATGTVASNGNVYIANGTYNEYGISDFSKNINFIGENRDNTIINGNNLGRVFTVGAQGATYTYTFNNLTFVNGNVTNNNGGAIFSYGITTINNCVFKNNTATYSGGAIISQGTGSNPANLVINNSYFIGNKVTSATGNGGAVYNAGIGYLTITGCDFINNTATTGSAVGGSSTIHFSRIIGTGNSLVSGTTNAVQNWWGNTDPTTRVPSTVTVLPYLVLTPPANITLAPGSSSIIYADLQHDSAGAYWNPANGHVPDGIPVTFAGNGGTVNPLSGASFNGLLITNFTAGAITGTYNQTFTVDGQNKNATVTISNVAPTNLAVSSASGYNGNSVNLIATLANGITPINGQTVNFYVNGGYVGNATTISGTATLPYTIIQGAGIYQILAQFLGSGTYSGSTGTNNLTVNFIPTNFVVNGPGDNYYRDVVSLTATLKDYLGNNLSNKIVYFNVNGNYAGAATTNGLGVATLSYTLNQSIGTYQLLANFLGNTIYAANSAVNSFTWIPTPTNLTVTPKTGYYNNSVQLIANLTDTVHNIPVNGRTVNFYVNGGYVGNTTTSNGMAYFTYTPTLDPGIYEILAQFAGDNGYITSNGTSSLTLNATTTSFINIASKSTYYNTPVNLTATLRDAIKTSNYYLSGKTVTFSVVNGSILGSVSTNTSGLASLSYTPLLLPGIYQILAQFDGDTGYLANNATFNLTVLYNPTKLNVTAKSGNYNGIVNLTATLKDINNNIISGQPVYFTVNNNPLTGFATTDAFGVATYQYTITQGAGIYTILAQFMGQGGYNASNSTNNLTVSPAQSYLAVNPASGYTGNNITLIAALWDANPIAISGKAIDFYINNVWQGQINTDINGIATWIYTITQGAGVYPGFIKAVYAGDPYYNGAIGFNTLTVIPDTTPPTVNATPPGGLYNATQNVVLTANEPATIYYTTDGSDPTTSSAQYTTPIIISANTVLKFLGIDASGNQSGIYTETYTIDTIAPTANATPAGGLYNTTQNVVLSANEPATIYYTTDGSDPTTSSTQYTMPIVISTNTVLKFLAVDLAGNQSVIYIETYTFDTTAPTASANPAGGSYNATQNVVLSTDPDAVVYYTTDGSDPTTSSTKYTAPIVISTNTVLKFLAIDLAGNQSGIYIENYIIDTTAPIASANPVGGTYNTAQSVVLSANEPATIYYTTDGSDPQTSSTRSVYSSPIAINNTTTLRFSAVDSLGNWSPVYNETYTISFSFTVDQIKVAASTVRAYIETYYKLPETVTINGTSVNMSQFLELLATATLQAYNGNNNPIPLGTFSVPPNPVDDIKTGNLPKSEYLKIANDVKNFMDSTGKTPDYAYQTSLGTHLGFQNLVYMYSMVLDYYNTSGKWGDFATMRPWAVINGLSTGIIPNGPTFTINQIKDAASTVRAYIETYYQLPNSVTINGTSVNMAQFLELLATATLQANNGNNNPIPLRAYNTPANPVDDIKTGNLPKSEYMKIANDVKNFMDSTGKTPDYAYQTSLGTHLGFQNLVYMYSMVLDYYNTSGKWGDFATMRPWAVINGLSTGIIPNGPTFTIAQIKEAATTVKTNVETNHQLPITVTINGTSINMAQFLELLATATLQINNGNTNPIPLRAYNTPPNPVDDIKTGNLPKSEYMKIANDVKNFMDTTGKTPDYAYQTSLGTHLGFQNLVYMYSQVLDYYSTNNALPNAIAMKPWSMI